MYRAALGLTNPVHMAELDAVISGYGERWMLDRTINYNDDDMVDPATAADILGVTVGTLRQYRNRGRIRATKTSDGWRYQVKDIREFGPVNLGRKKRESLAEC